MAEQSVEPISPRTVPALPVISYRGGPEATHSGIVTYIRMSDKLVVTIPPPPFGRQMVRASIMLALVLVMAMFFAFMTIVMMMSRGTGNAPSATITAVLATFFCWNLVTSIRRIVYISRDGRQPSILTVGPSGLEIHSPGKLRPRTIHIEPASIFDLQVIPPATRRGSRVVVQIVTRDDEMHLIDLPWQDGQPMIELEDHLRSALELHPTRI
jgi:hypothetical protein